MKSYHHIKYSRPVIKQLPQRSSVLSSVLLSWIFVVTTCLWYPLRFSIITLKQFPISTTVLFLPPTAVVVAISSRHKLYNNDDDQDDNKENKRKKKQQHKGYTKNNNKNTKNNNRFKFGGSESFQKAMNGTEFLKSIFRDTNSKKPRHIIQGLWYGMKSALTGSIAALVSVVMKPVLGFKENEWIGLGLGMLSGTLYAVVFTLYGYGQGVYQLYQGLIATPAAIYAAHVGQIWNETSQKYDYYNLDQEANETKSSEYDTNRNVADMTYYNLLQVNTTASSKEIKRAYYRIARDVHPDKNNSKEAGELFRQLHIAYTTLYDEEKRSIYDMYGLTGNANSTNADIPIHFDPHIFFGILFNSQLVEPYIGELTISSFTDHLVHFASHNMNIQVEKMSPGENMNLLRNFMKNNQNQHNRKSLKRQIDIALYLRTQVEPYATGSMSQMEFRNKCRQEAMQILDGNPLFGYQFLHTIGTALTSEAKQFLSIQHFYSIPGFINSIISSIRKVHQRSQRLITSTKKTFAVLRLVAEAYEKNLSNKQINMYSEPSSGAFMQDDELKKLLPALLDMAWSYNTHDISYILHGACKKVFLDYSNINSKYKRLIRAEAIQILGEEFLAQSILYTTNINHKMNSKNNKNADIGEDFDIDDYNEEIFTRLEVAFQISQMKASGQDAPQDAEELIEKKKKQRNRKSKPRVVRRHG